MTRTIKTLTIILLVAVGQFAFSQTNKEIAYSKCKEAIELMDNGKIDESIILLQEVQKLDPDKFDYPYELAYAHYLKEEYKGAVKILEKIKTHKDVSEQLFQLLGNSYDVLGKSDKAFEIYDEGLKMFPNSGILYLEKGNVYWGKKEYRKAIPFYEKGIEVNPEAPSNYYRIARIYCGSSEEVWGMIYGEIFMNLERNSQRTTEISKLLYDTYKSEIKFTSDTSFSVSFSTNNTIDINDIKLPFGVGVYEPTLMISMLNEKTIDINSLNRIRKSFIENYFKNENSKKYPNILFEYQNKVLQAGHIEAYNHWILMKGDEEGFKKWYSENQDKWDAFVKWFGENGLKVDKSNKFFREQY